MGLLGGSTYYCGICGNETDENLFCSTCETHYHSKCLKQNGHVKKENNLIRSDTFKIKCPNCGNVGTP